MTNHSLSSRLFSASILRPNVIVVDQPLQGDPNVYLNFPRQWLVVVLEPKPHEADLSLPLLRP